MGGTPLRLEDVVSPVELERDEKEKAEKERAQKARQEGGAPKVISLQDRRKNSYVHLCSQSRKAAEQMPDTRRIYHVFSTVPCPQNQGE